MKFVACNCPVGMTYHALNCPDKPGQPQNLPAWAKPKASAPASRQDG